MSYNSHFWFESRYFWWIFRAISWIYSTNINAWQNYHTCETPALAWWAFFWSPQLPVAREYLRPSVIILVLMDNSRLKSLPLSMNFCAYNRTSYNVLAYYHSTWKFSFTFWPWMSWIVTTFLRSNKSIPPCTKDSHERLFSSHMRTSPLSKLLFCVFFVTYSHFDMVWFVRFWHRLQFSLSRSKRKIAIWAVIMIILGPNISS